MSIKRKVISNSNMSDASVSKSPYFTNNETESASIQLENNASRLKDSFYNIPCEDLAKKLLGKVICRKLDTGEVLKGKIVETESYVGVEDKSCHSYKGKKTQRNEAMFMKPGTAYVYTIYGMYYCLNISSDGEGAAVLIRSLEPLWGLETMRAYRTKRRPNRKELKDKELCNGPSKLCMALDVTKLLNKDDMTVSDRLWVEDCEDVGDEDIVRSKRIGIDSAGEEWANKLLRFYVRNNIYVSVKDKKAEMSQAHEF
ncbi:uncharacterized protein [Centruroides vittatus]|uniref:uncharacterized protein n=1 Tax=Centruroides vittatus TaxID=120091 RepID=UPI0035108709